MTRFDIPWEDNYIGTWIGDRSRVLTIRKVADRKYLVSLTIDGEPVRRPWMNGETTIDMPAEYTFDAFDGAEFCVNLWPPKRRRLMIHLHYAPRYRLGPEYREVLTFSMSHDVHMPEPRVAYCEVIGGFGHFVRAELKGE